MSLHICRLVLCVFLNNANNTPIQYQASVSISFFILTQTRTPLEGLDAGKGWSRTLRAAPE